MARLRRKAKSPALGPWSVAVLLGGWAAWPRGVARAADLEPHDRETVRGMWRGGYPEVARLWREHETFLRAQADALKVRPGYGAQWFGEQVALRSANVNAPVYPGLAAKKRAVG